MTLKDDLIAAKALIDTPEKWRKDDSNDHQSCCAIIAVHRSISGDGIWADGERAGAVRSALFGALPEEWLQEEAFNIAVRIGDFNDHPDTTHDDIMALFDRAIAAET